MDTNMKLMVNMTEAIRRELQNIVELWKETKGGHLAVSSQLCVCVPLVVTGIRLDCTFDSVFFFMFKQGDAPHLKRGHLTKRLFRLC